MKKPFLRWAGGKNWFVKYLPLFIQNIEYNNYIEPFLGGGSVFFALEPERAYLSDLNHELIETFISMRDDVSGVIKQLLDWEINEETYYRLREEPGEDPVYKAARFIFLNQTSYNGIYRVNKKGQYNVPYGRRKNYRFDYSRFEEASIALQNATLTCESYEAVLERVKEKDLVFLDPPYTVAHNNNGFIEYNKKLFSIQDQEKLRKCIDEINNRNAYFIMTNAAHETIHEIFSGCGYEIEVSRHSVLGGTGAKRGAIMEYVYTNIPDVKLGATHE